MFISNSYSILLEKETPRGKPFLTSKAKFQEILTRILLTLLGVMCVSCSETVNSIDQVSVEPMVEGILAGDKKSLLQGDAIPTEKAAIGVAIAILRPIYGDAVIDREQPFTAYKYKGHWLVTGSLHVPEGRIMVGGVAEVLLKADTGQVIYVSHGK